MSKNKTVGIFTLGCRVNQYESCAIAERLKRLSYDVLKDGTCDYYIVNTCAVTAESERKSRQLVRRCASKGKTLVIGCASQLNPSDFDIENVIYVCGNRNKSSVADVINGDAFRAKMSVESMDGAPYENMNLCDKDELFSECRAFIKIQDGCNGKCTYCIIPKCRGKVRSRDINDILEETSRLVNAGYKELILTGIEVGAYNKIPLCELVKRVSEIEGVERIRLGSLSPNVISEKFLETVSKCKNFMPHIHLSIQSCSDNVLSRMARPYKKKDIVDRINKIREYIPNCSISADIIVGFPGETEEDFLETVHTLSDLEVFHVHSFPYSEREGTKAAVMENGVPKSVRVERNARLINENKKVRERIFEKMIGRETTLLIEKIRDGYAFGHSAEFFETRIDAGAFSVGDIVTVKYVSFDGSVCFAIPI